eukprot:7327359-Pyramimonas_sp.AAC.1
MECRMLEAMPWMRRFKWRITAESHRGWLVGWLAGTLGALGASWGLGSIWGPEVPWGLRGILGGLGALGASCGLKGVSGT